MLLTLGQFKLVETVDGAVRIEGDFKGGPPQKIDVPAEDVDELQAFATLTSAALALTQTRRSAAALAQLPPAAASAVELLSSSTYIVDILEAGELDDRARLVQILEAVQGRLQKIPSPETGSVPVAGEADAGGGFGAHPLNVEP